MTPSSNPYRETKKQRKPLLGNHQKCWIWGRNAVRETIFTERWTVWELWVADDREEIDEEMISRAESQNIVVNFVTSAQLAKQIKAADHQGCAAKMAPFPYTPWEEIASSLKPTSRLVILDHIQDPNNFGAIVRSADVFGFSAIIISKTNQVGVTSAVARSSVGAVNHIPITTVADLDDCMIALKEQGVKIYGMALKGTSQLSETVFPDQPIAIMIGNEANGIREDIAKACDEKLLIPVMGKVDSLNAAVAAGVVFYEVAKQKGK